MFERFSKGARMAVVLAQEEARELRSERIDAGHLLLAMMSNDQVAGVFADLGGDADGLRRRVAEDGGQDLDAEALASLGIDLDRVRGSVESLFGAGALDRPARRWRGGHIPFDRSAKRSLEGALREATRLGHRKILVWHVLLGVVRAVPAMVDQLIGAEGAHESLRTAAERRLRERAA